jgi:hypothetical protein
MLSGSVVQMSGQIWKMHISTVAVWVGIGISIFGLFSNILYILVGLAIGLTAIAYCCFAIRCPKCNVHWYWRAIKSFEIGWVKKLLSQTKCPSCGYGEVNAI